MVDFLSLPKQQQWLILVDQYYDTEDWQEVQSDFRIDDPYLVVMAKGYQRQVNQAYREFQKRLERYGLVKPFFRKNRRGFHG